MSGDSRGGEEDLSSGVSTSPGPGGAFEWNLPLDGRSESFEPVPFLGSNEEEPAYESVNDANEGNGNKRSAPNAVDEPAAAVPAISRRKKKPKGMPKRPLSAYNLFFQRERPRILQADSESAGVDGKRLAFDELGKIIGQRWRALKAEDRREYEDLAVQDSVRYRREMEAFNEAKRKKIDHIEKGPPAISALAAGDTSSLFPPQAMKRGDSSDSYPPPLQARMASSSGPFLEGAQYFPPPSHRPQYNPEQGRGSFSSSQYLPPVYPTLCQPPPPHMDPSVFPIPPGMELMLPDRDGRERKFKVQYTCYSMTREAAHQYIERLSGSYAPPLPPTPQSDGNNAGGSPVARFPTSWGNY